MPIFSVFCHHCTVERLLSLPFLEPQLATNQDHLVRKIFSKFRRNPQPGPRDGQSQSDVEKGDEPERGKVSSVISITVHVHCP